MQVQCACDKFAILDEMHTGPKGLLNGNGCASDCGAGRIQPDYARSFFQALPGMFLDHPILHEQRRTMAPEEVSPQAVEDLLAITERFDRQDKLGEKRHPEQEKKGKKTDEVEQDPVQIGPPAPHTVDLRTVHQQQECQPAGNIEPGSSIERFFVHLPEFYIING